MRAASRRALVPLAERMLRHDWRRFAPATLAVGFAGVLLLVQGALILGIFSTAAVYVNNSAADLWIGYPGTRSVELGRPIDETAEMLTRMDPDIVRVDRLQWLDADWRNEADGSSVSVVITGVALDPQGLLFSEVIPSRLRSQLLEPMTFIADQADLDKLELTTDGYGWLEGRRMRLLGAVRGLRALGGVDLVTSYATAARLGAPGSGARSATYLLARVRDDSEVEQVRERLQAASHSRYQVWTRSQLSRRSMLYWLFDTGAGLGFVFAAVIVLLVGIIITSQTLIGAIAGSLKEFATLRALGVSREDLRRVILKQSAIVGAAGLLFAAALSEFIVLAARSHSVPVLLTPWVFASGIAVAMVVALLSGVAAARTMRGADPALLLR